jgi:Uri superfamily endonuclease
VEIPNIVIIGGESRAGTYVLRIRLIEDTTLRFGRFKSGKLISLPAGEYAYVGSALSEKGSTSLARRLIRHATRSRGQRPHRIREEMMRRFVECGLGNGNLLPKDGKALFWNIDFLLDLGSAEIVSLYVVRLPKRLESMLAKQLERDSHTQVIERGLGANDVPGNTHLLHVSAEEPWWESLPIQLANVAKGNA